MSLEQLHAKLLDSLRDSTPLVIEPSEMRELWNDIKQTLDDYEAVSQLLAWEGGA